MICVDISNVWGQLSLPDLLALEQEVAAAHEAVAETEKDLPEAETDRIREAAGWIREDSEICVVVGSDIGCLAARAAVELLQGACRNLKKGKGDPKILYAGNTLSTRHWNELTGLLEGKDFSVIAVSRTGTELESAVALRGLRWMLERKYGTDRANRRIYAVAESEDSALGQMAREAGWKLFALSSRTVLTAAALLPMAVAGIDIEKVLQGGEEAQREYNIRSLENPLWQYAAVRNLLYRGGKAAELLASWEPGFSAFGRWWQQLFAGAEGREGKGLLPMAVELPGEAGGLAQMIRRGERNLLETMVRFASTEQKHIIGSQWNDPDGLNHLEGTPLDRVEEQACQQTLDAHAESGVPVITMDCGELKEETVGELFRFLELACAVSARVLGVVPVDTPEAEI